MSEDEPLQAKEYSTRVAVAYGFAFFADVTAAQMVAFLLFTFYFAVVGLRHKS